MRARRVRPEDTEIIGKLYKILKSCKTADQVDTCYKFGLRIYARVVFPRNGKFMKHVLLDSFKEMATHRRYALHGGRHLNETKARLMQLQADVEKEIGYNF